jgi:hypothetical protein
VPARGGESQRLVRETMIAAGGYWRPLAAVARLLEELGELLELLDGGATPELGGELADLWIITTALADQFLAEVPEPGGVTGENGGRGVLGVEVAEPTGVTGENGERGALAADAIKPRGDAGTAGDPAGARLVVAAGPIARVVNHYDGPKVPREGVPMPSLTASIAGFHDRLCALAAALGVDLADAVRSKLHAIRRRGDIERFARDGFDPSTAPVLARLGGDPLLPARLWGAPDLSPTSSPQEWAEAISGSLLMFAKAARPERLEGYAIELPPGADRLGALVAALDPGASGGEEQAFGHGGTALLATTLPAAAAGPIALVRPAP